jgi:hypothetical protein
MATLNPSHVYQNHTNLTFGFSSWRKQHENYRLYSRRCPYACSRLIHSDSSRTIFPLSSTFWRANTIVHLHLAKFTYPGRPSETPTYTVLQTRILFFVFLVTVSPSGYCQPRRFRSYRIARFGIVFAVPIQFPERTHLKQRIQWSREALLLLYRDDRIRATCCELSLYLLRLH